MSAAGEAWSMSATVDIEFRNFVARRTVTLTEAAWRGTGVCVSFDVTHDEWMALIGVEPTKPQDGAP